MALAEVMEDPLSRKAGSSLFSELIFKTSEAFRLDALYSNLHDKIQRLDMLGMHINENIQEYSDMLIQEGTRSAQLTLEFLEALIIGVYSAELTHILGVRLGEEGHRPFPYPLSEWWSFFAIALGAFLTALPLITLIRSGRSKFSLENPPWLEFVEEYGKLIGPAILLMMVYLGAFSTWVNDKAEFISYRDRAFVVHYSLWNLSVFVGVYLVIIYSWSHVWRHKLAGLAALCRRIIAAVFAPSPRAKDVGAPAASPEKRKSAPGGGVRGIKNPVNQADFP